MFLVLFSSRCTAYIVRDHAKTFKSVGLSCKVVILFLFHIMESSNLIPTNFNAIIKTNKHAIAETRLRDLKGSSSFFLFSMYTGWKGSKCHHFNSRRGRLKGPKKLYNIGSKHDSFLRKRCSLFCFVYVVLLISLEIMRKKLHQ